MTRLYNDPTNFRKEMIDGFVAAYGRYLRRVPDASGVMAHGAPTPGKVSVLIGGGSGHYPAFCGYVGPGFATGAVIGEIFTSPSTEQVYRCTQAIAADKGVVYSYGNYSGDVMNFDMAAMRCDTEGIDVRTVLVTDDVASAPPGKEDERRGIAGDFYVFKVASASADRGDSLDDVERYARLANARTRSFGIAFNGCTLPGQSEPLFTVEPGKMELGLGVHGEPGIATDEMRPAREVAGLLVKKLLDDVPSGLSGGAGDKVAVLLNGLGAIKYEELFVLYGSVQQKLVDAGLALHKPIVTEMVTSLDMAGCSLSLLWLDEELETLLDAPCESPAYVKV